MTFKNYTQLKNVILEKSDPGIELHLTHLEDLAIIHGKKGFTYFSDQVKGLLAFLMGLSSDVKLNLKVDGSPMIAFGMDPRPKFKNRFFVSTKSGFNVRFPKINHSEADIEANHQGPLADTLKVALNELAKLHDHSGLIYQGDLLFAHPNDKKLQNIEGTRYLTFKPNTLVYAIPEDPQSELFHRVNTARLGIILHDSFKGHANADGETIRVTPAGKDFTKIKERGKQHHIFIEDSNYPSVDLNVPTVSRAKIGELLTQCQSYITELSEKFNDYWTTNPIMLSILKTYLNYQVRTDGGIFKLAVKGRRFDISTFKRGFINYIKQKYEKESKEKKRDTTRISILAKRDQLLKFIDEFTPDLTFLLQATYAMIQIKYELLNVINEIESKLGKSFYQLADGTLQATTGEGFVSFLGGNQVKLVDRLNFSKMNFLKEAKEANTLRRIGIFAGAFKPPTLTHFDILQRAAQENEVVYIIISPKEREPVTAEMSKRIWELYTQNLRNIKIKVSKVTPITDMYDLVKKYNDRPDAKRYIVSLYAGEDDSDRFNQLKGKFVGKLGSFFVKKMPRTVSASSIRDAMQKGHWDTVARNVPEGEFKERVMQLLRAAAGGKPLLAEEFAPEERKAKIARLKEINAQARALAEKGGLTRPEAEQFRKLQKEANGIRFELYRGTSIDKIKSLAERGGNLSPEVVVVARNDLMRDRAIYDAIIDSAVGVYYNAETPIDDIVRGKNANVSEKDLYNAFSNTRAAMKAQYGNEITLYRATGEQRKKPTQNWATTEDYAKQFGRNVISKTIPVDDVLAVNVGPNGNYHEVILKSS